MAAIVKLDGFVFFGARALFDNGAALAVRAVSDGLGFLGLG
jgi:hypothetical protein